MVVPRSLFRCHANICLVAKPFDMQRVSATTNGAILIILLRIAGGDIERNHDLLATGITKIRRFFLHFKGYPQCFFSAFDLSCLPNSEPSRQAVAWITVTAGIEIAILTTYRWQVRCCKHIPINTHDLQVSRPMQAVRARFSMKLWGMR